jgi:translation initiation factor IF-2
MSVRVHAIAKEINKSSKELIEILTERGYEIKSASASIDNITAQSLIEEFSSKQEESSVEQKVEDAKESTEEKVVSPEPAKSAPIVKSKADLEQERKEKEEAEQELKAEAAPYSRSCPCSFSD